MKTFIYQVTIEVLCEDADRSYKTFEFSTREKAIDCITYLYNNRFNYTSSYVVNPFAGYSEEEQKYTNTRKGSEIVDGQERIDYFNVTEELSCSEIYVSLLSKEIDTDIENWVF